ncbi:MULTISPECIES: hypothetical protein [unclassified Brevibacterium]|uniref:hypothetical protein n=1 Tax=unclassified Brevibacterium TaxID=2614124 RepID=UPI001E477786|nr:MULTISPECIES: hypothetical protein [unclassified Brevibacterium]MCD1287317.1 hypothetical protein [Brevibacterium sp. CCUG 69071]MDK8436429.1 hypothetical protein [Brevibacterium sp. H-BE7]
MSTEPYTPDEVELRDCYALVMDERAGEDYDEAKADAERGIAKIKADALREAAEAISLVVIPGSDENDNLATAAAQGWLTGRANRIEEEA